LVCGKVNFLQKLGREEPTKREKLDRSGVSGCKWVGSGGDLCQERLKRADQGSIGRTVGKKWGR